MTTGDFLKLMVFYLASGPALLIVMTALAYDNLESYAQEFGFHIMAKPFIINPLGKQMFCTAAIWRWLDRYDAALLMIVAGPVAFALDLLLWPLGVLKGSKALVNYEVNFHRFLAINNLI